MELPIAVPVEGESASGASAAEVQRAELRAKVRELRLKTFTFTNTADIHIDFSKTLEVALYPEYDLPDCCCCNIWYEPRVIFWHVKIRNGSHTQAVRFDGATGNKKGAPELVREIEEAQVEYESAVRVLRAFERASHS